MTQVQAMQQEEQDVPISRRNSGKLNVLLEEFTERAAELGYDQYIIALTNKADIQARRGITKAHNQACSEMQIAHLKRLVDNMPAPIAMLLLLSLLENLKEKIS